jgi:sugar lactone lactonase YvrE
MLASRTLAVCLAATVYACVSLFACGQPEPVVLRAARSPIALENEKPGTDRYKITHPAANHEVEGYASQASIRPGEAIDLMVNVARPTRVGFQLFRMGYYQGLGARQIAERAPVPVEPQPSCPVDDVSGLVECNWSPTFRVVIDPTATSGQYLFKLVTSEGLESYVPLLVREGDRRAPLLVQSSVTTWQAYNRWGGTSLYRNQLPPGAKFMGSHADKVSFDRPYEYTGDHVPPQVQMGAGQLFVAEVDMWRWLEKEGYDLGYTTNLDVDADPGSVLGRRAFLSVGHDEYWTVAERDALEAARAAGVSLGFFSANTGYWRIRLESTAEGTQRRIITCYKSASADPVQNRADTTDQFRRPPFARPENALLGVMYDLWSEVDAYPLIVKDPTHWIYEGTGVVAGETLANVVGYEWDHVANNGLTPGSLQVVAESPAVAYRGAVGPSHVTVYAPTPNSVVFAAGSIEWSWGLARAGYADERIQRMTENVLARAGLEPNEYVTPASERSRDVGTSRSVSLLAGSGKPGVLDGLGPDAEFTAPAGLAAAPDGSLWVSDADNVRRIGPDGTVSTPVRCENGKFPDGSACLSGATGIAVDAEGSIYVSDTGHQLIRKLTATGMSKYAGSGRGELRDSSKLAEASFHSPRGLAFAPDGSLYVADAENGAIRRIDASGVTTVASGLRNPTAVAFSDDGVLYALATADRMIYVVNGARASPISFTLPSGSNADSPAPPLRAMDGLLFDQNRLLFSDTGSYRVRQLTLSPSPRVSTLVGDGSFGQTLGSRAEVVLPRGLARYGDGFAVADCGNYRVLFFRTP